MLSRFWRSRRAATRRSRQQRHGRAPDAPARCGLRGILVLDAVSDMSADPRSLVDVADDAVVAAVGHVGLHRAVDAVDAAEEHAGAVARRR